eukprot:TRINITY_DN39603_c0_g1_i1.p1 TRINITY_DN39603_c0_g1~~TRINITY_DN39603_c0_g1_i1.p1  ORF type:complete len:288 (+),score=49.11 TRINITY_DN39603_c0_g1_i1:46-909(+)
MSDLCEDPLLGATPLILYDNPLSIHAQYARIALEEAQEAFERVYVNLPMGNLSPTIARMNPGMSIPFLCIPRPSMQPTLICDSRDIAMYAAQLPGGTHLLREERRDSIVNIMDMIYGCNGGQFAFAYQRATSSMFDNALGVLGAIRSLVLRWHRRSSPDLVKIYDEKIESVSVPLPEVKEWLDKAAQVAAFLDKSLQDSGGPWLLGSEHTLADSLASVWMQWILWSGAPVPFSDRTLEFLRRGQERKAYARTQPAFVISFIMLRIRAVMVLVSCSLILGATKVFGFW